MSISRSPTAVFGRFLILWNLETQALTLCSGSDLHTLRSGWGQSLYPCCVGHEVVGTAVKVGKNVKHFKVGDIVGVGAQSSSCGQCKQCKAGKEQYCSKVSHRSETGQP